MCSAASAPCRLQQARARWWAPAGDRRVCGADVGEPAVCMGGEVGGNLLTRHQIVDVAARVDRGQVRCQGPACCCAPSQAASPVPGLAGRHDAHGGQHVCRLGRRGGPLLLMCPDVECCHIGHRVDGGWQGGRAAPGARRRAQQHSQSPAAQGVHASLSPGAQGRGVGRRSLPGQRVSLTCSDHNLLKTRVQCPRILLCDPTHVAPVSLQVRDLVALHQSKLAPITPYLPRGCLAAAASIQW